MSSNFGPRSLSESEHRTTTTGTVIFSYICVGLTGTAFFCVIFFYLYQKCIRSRAPVTATGSNRAERRAGVDLTRLPEFAYSGGDGAQCSVCIGALQVGEKVRWFPLCKHLYHVECIDMWLASHTTCPLCRADVEPPVDDGQVAPAEQEQAIPV